MDQNLQVKSFQSAKYLVLLCLFTVFIWLLTACQTSNDPQVVSGVGDPRPTQLDNSAKDQAAGNPSAAASEPDDPQTIQIAWETSPHASTYVLSQDGTNSTCARCHAPANWTPSMDDMPESCYSCKFTVEPPPPVIEESAWEHVQCKICHKMKKDAVEPGYAWLEIPQIEEYVSLATTTELCQKCHNQIDVPGHLGSQVGGAHSEMACTDCHNAHSTQASCADSTCHEDFEYPSEDVAGHDSAHAIVACSACHDASGLAVGPDETGQWVTFSTQAAHEGGDPVSYISHNTVLEAPCERCHFQGNEWDLELLPETE